MNNNTIYISAVTFRNMGARDFADKVSALLEKSEVRYIVRGLHLSHLSDQNKSDLVVVEDESSGIGVLANIIREKVKDATFPVVSLNTISHPFLNHKLEMKNREIRKIPGDERTLGVYRDGELPQAVGEVIAKI